MMRVGELVKWDDPGKNEVGIVMYIPDTFTTATRVQGSWFSSDRVRVSYPALREIKLVEPRKVNESR